MKFIAYYDSPLGKITLAGDEAGLCGLWFEGEKYYAHALTASSANGKFCMRDIAAKTDAAARGGCYERGGADKKRGSADLLAKEQRAASETQRDFAALKKNDTAAKAANSADGKFCAHTYNERKILHARFCGSGCGRKTSRDQSFGARRGQKILHKQAKRAKLVI